MHTHARAERINTVARINGARGLGRRFHFIYYAFTIMLSACMPIIRALLKRFVLPLARVERSPATFVYECPSIRRADFDTHIIYEWLL